MAPYSPAPNLTVTPNLTTAWRMLINAIHASHLSAHPVASPLQSILAGCLMSSSARKHEPRPRVLLPTQPLPPPVPCRSLVSPLLPPTFHAPLFPSRALTAPALPLLRPPLPPPSTGLTPLLRMCLILMTPTGTQPPPPTAPPLPPHRLLPLPRYPTLPHTHLPGTQTVTPPHLATSLPLPTNPKSCHLNHLPIGHLHQPQKQPLHPHRGRFTHTAMDPSSSLILIGAQPDAHCMGILNLLSLVV